MKRIKGTEYYTAPEFSREIGVCVNTIYNWHATKKLVPAFITPTGHRYYSRAQMDEVLGTGMREESEN